MLTQEEIESSMLECAADSRLESKFLRDLLNATVYAFLPINDDHPRLRVVMFRQPSDGLHFIPFFTSEWQALEALGDDRKLFVCGGRTLLEATRGATLILNPNRESFTIYPEEVEALLTTGFVANVSSTRLEQPKQICARSPEPIPEKLVSLLKELYGSLLYIASARLLETWSPENPGARTLIICLEVRPPHAERAARATANALQTPQTDWGTNIDILSSNPGERRDLFDLGLLIYENFVPDTSEIAPGLPARRLGPSDQWPTG